jgi:hypothetical protein
VVASGATLNLGSSANLTVSGMDFVNGTVNRSSGAVTQETRSIGGTGEQTFALANVIVNVTTKGSLSSLQVKLTESNHLSATTGIETGRYWTFTPDAAGYTLNMTLPHNSIPDDNDKLCRWTGSAWNCAADSFETTYNTITRNGINALSDWATGDDVGDEGEPTAVTLSDFTARPAGRDLTGFGNLSGLGALAAAGAVAGMLLRRRCNPKGLETLRISAYDGPVVFEAALRRGNWGQ